MALPALVILPESPEGTKVMTIGLPDEPRSPAFTVGASDSLLQTGGGAVGLGAVAAGAVVAAGAAVAAGAVVGTAVGAAVGVAAGAQAPANSARSAKPANN